MENGIEYEDIPCSCGITHKQGDDTYDIYDLVLGHVNGEPMYKSVTRCKTCKYITMQRRKL